MMQQLATYRNDDLQRAAARRRVASLARTPRTEGPRVFLGELLIQAGRHLVGPEAAATPGLSRARLH